MLSRRLQFGLTMCMLLCAVANSGFDNMVDKHGAVKVSTFVITVLYDYHIFIMVTFFFAVNCF